MKYANVDNARKFAEHMVPHVVRPAQIIWNKAIGAVFLLIACMVFPYAVRYYKNPNPLGFVLCIVFGAVMAGFGISSFLKARRLSRL